ncbi:MAG: hypothetical protein AAF791_06355 [Bacteroidota bacterium]
MPLSTDDLDPDVLKAAVAEALRENRDWLREVVQEALESCAMDEAQREAELRADAARAPLSLGGVRGHA